MLFSGVVQCAQKFATQYGGCRALAAFWKWAAEQYHENKKVCESLISKIFKFNSLQCKYRKAAHKKIAISEGVFGEKMMVDSVYNCLVNDQGIFVYCHSSTTTKTSTTKQQNNLNFSININLNSTSTITSTQYGCDIKATQSCFNS